MKRSVLLLVGALFVAPLAHAQLPVPPTDSPVVLRNIQLKFPTQASGGSERHLLVYLDMADADQLVGLPDEWVPYSDAEAVILGDAARFWQSGLFESLWVDVVDDSYENGVVAMRAVFNFVERPDVEIPTAGFPTPLPEYQEPPSGGRRLYP